MLLSVLMPSNRDLANSRRAIETALAFCEKCDAILIVSDNSGDPEKRAVLGSASPRLRYIQPDDDTPHTNVLNVLAAAETEFVLMMGDDDELFVSPKDAPLDLATLGPDCIGVRPLIAVANSAGRVIRVKDFAILDETPGARVMAYNSYAKGDNAAYYSIFRRQPFVDLMRFFLAHHPLKAGFSDWALTSVLFSYGKLPYDPGTIFKYNFHQWDDPGKLEQQTRSSFAAVGLPGTAERYKLLLLYLDILILAQRQGSPLDEAGKRNLARHAGKPILAGFLNRMRAEPDCYDESAHAQAGRIRHEPDAGGQFELALGMADCIQPGLAERYQAFHRTAMEG